MYVISFFIYISLSFLVSFFFLSFDSAFVPLPVVSVYVRQRRKRQPVTDGGTWDALLLLCPKGRHVPKDLIRGKTLTALWGFGGHT